MALKEAYCLCILSYFFAGGPDIDMIDMEHLLRLFPLFPFSHVIDIFTGLYLYESACGQCPKR